MYYGDILEDTPNLKWHHHSQIFNFLGYFYCTLFLFLFSKKVEVVAEREDLSEAKKQEQLNKNKDKNLGKIS